MASLFQGSSRINHEHLQAHREACVVVVSTAAHLRRHVALDLQHLRRKQLQCGQGHGARERFQYTNTWYHTAPLLDIMQPAPQWLGNNDFVLTSDVFEHVPPPVQRAFDNLYALLKPGGIAVFSVPYTLSPATQEHYPNLHDFSLRRGGNGEWILHNVTQGGVQEEFRELVFHGGPGSTLEMRLFGHDALQEHLRLAGFTDVRTHSEPCFEHGIFWLPPCNPVMSMLKPA